MKSLVLKANRCPPILLPFALSCLASSSSIVNSSVKFLLLRQRRNRTFPDLRRTFMHIPPQVSLLKSAEKAEKRLAAVKRKKKQSLSFFYTQTSPRPAVYKVILYFGGELCHRFTVSILRANFSAHYSNVMVVTILKENRPNPYTAL